MRFVKAALSHGYMISLEASHSTQVQSRASGGGPFWSGQQEELLGWLNNSPRMHRYDLRACLDRMQVASEYKA